MPPTSTAPAKNPVPPTSTASSPVANAGRGGRATHTAPPVRTAGRSNVAGRGVQPPKPTHSPLHGTAAPGQTGPAYVVKTHDTLWALAATHLGNPNRWSELFNLNRDRPEPGGRLVDPNLIYRGWTLVLPVSAKAVSPDRATPETAETVYVVRPGDTLWSLAATHLGNPNRWNELFEMNRGRAEPGGNLVNPNLIYAGWTLKFPVGATGISPHTTATRAITAQGSKRAAAVPANNLAAGAGTVTPHRPADSSAEGWSV